MDDSRERVVQKKNCSNLEKENRHEKKKRRQHPRPRWLATVLSYAVVRSRRKDAVDEKKKSRSAGHVMACARIGTSARSTPAAGGTQGVNKQNRASLRLPTYSTSSPLFFLCALAGLLLLYLAYVGAPVYDLICFLPKSHLLKVSHDIGCYTIRAYSPDDAPLN